MNGILCVVTVTTCIRFSRTQESHSPSLLLSLSLPSWEISSMNDAKPLAKMYHCCNFRLDLHSWKDCIFCVCVCRFWWRAMCVCGYILRYSWLLVRWTHTRLMLNLLLIVRSEIIPFVHSSSSPTSISGVCILIQWATIHVKLWTKCELKRISNSLAITLL